MPVQPTVLTPGAPLPVKTSITNLAKAVDIDMKSTLPVGATYLSSNPTGTYSTTPNVIGWAFNLAEAQTKEVFLTLQVPATAGDSTLQTTVSTDKSDMATQYGNPLTLPISVTAAAKTSADAITAMQALTLVQEKEQKLRDDLAAQLQSAMASFQLNTAAGYETTIGQLIQVIDQLSGLSVDTRAIHDDVDRLLKEAQWRWTMAPAAAAK